MTNLGTPLRYARFSQKSSVFTHAAASPRSSLRHIPPLSTRASWPPSASSAARWYSSELGKSAFAQAPGATGWTLGRSDLPVQSVPWSSGCRGPSLWGRGRYGAGSRCSRQPAAIRLTDVHAPSGPGTRTWPTVPHSWHRLEAW